MSAVSIKLTISLGEANLIRVALQDSLVAMEEILKNAHQDDIEAIRRKFGETESLLRRMA